MTDRQNEDHDLILFEKINNYCSKKSLSLIKNIYLNKKTNNKIIEKICLKSIEHDFIDALKYLHNERRRIIEF